MSTKKRENLADYIGINSKCSLSILKAEYIYITYVHWDVLWVFVCTGLTIQGLSNTVCAKCVAKYSEEFC